VIACRLVIRSLDCVGISGRWSEGALGHSDRSGRLDVARWYVAAVTFHVKRRGRR
jgi:hypothetical protein